MCFKFEDGIHVSTRDTILTMHNSSQKLKVEELHIFHICSPRITIPGDNDCESHARQRECFAAATDARSLALLRALRDSARCHAQPIKSARASIIASLLSADAVYCCSKWIILLLQNGTGYRAQMKAVHNSSDQRPL